MRPTAAPSLIGRDVELAAITAALADDRPVLVTGEAGIGKTTLVRAAAAQTGRPLLQGAGYATLAAMPYLALRLALGSPVAGERGAVARRVEAAVGDGILFLDDLQWLDRDTLGVVSLLAGRIGLVLASRERWAADAGPLPAQALAEIRLGPLAPSAAEAVARQGAHDLAPAALRAVLERAAGNPLLIEELARDGRPSPTVARAIAGHLAEASAPARDALNLMAVADRPLPSRPLADVAGELLDLGLAVVSPDDSLTIRHVLIADRLLERLDPDERRRVHARVAELVDDDVDRALHLSRAGLPVEAKACALEALEATPDLRRRAVLLRIAAEASDGDDAADLRIRAAQAAMGTQDAEAALRILEPIESNNDLQALVLVRRAQALGQLGRYPESEALLDEARGLRLGPTTLAAHELAVETSISATSRGHGEAGIRALDDLDDAASGDDPARRVERAALRALNLVLLGRETDITPMYTAFEAAIDERSPAAVARAVNLHGVIIGTRGTSAALAFALDVVPRLRAIGLDASQLASELVQTLTFRGRNAEAVIAADELLEQPYPFFTRGWTLSQRAVALCQLGRFADAEADLRTAEPLLLDEWSERGEALSAAAEIAYWSGRPRDAIALAERALLVPSHYLGNYLLVGLTRAWSQADLDQPPGRLVAAPDSWAQRAADAEWAALCELAAGRPAVAAFDDAAAAWEDHLVFRAVVCRWAAGEAARRQAMGDAAARLRGALATTEELSYEPLAARCRRSLRLAGVRVRATSAPRSGAGLLTAREREVLALVAAGQSNIEIARRMGLGRPTVTRILSNAMAKLGATSRAQAVTLLRAIP